MSSKNYLNFYDYFLLFGTLYTMIGSDIMLNWGAGLITGKRLSNKSKNPLETLYYKVHAINDPNMRSTKPISLPNNKIPAWNHALAVSNGTLVVILELIILSAFYHIYQGETGTIPDYIRFATAAWIMRSVWGDISYWHELTQNPVAPLTGGKLMWYYFLAIPQIIIPWLIAERFYEGTYEYNFNFVRFSIFLCIPLFLMLITRLLYIG